MEVESQLELLNNRMLAATIAETRDNNPKLAAEQLYLSKFNEGELF